jgi:hypothetical protein
MSLKHISINSIATGYWINGEYEPEIAKKANVNDWRSYLIPGNMLDRFKYVLNKLSPDDTYLLIPMHTKAGGFYTVHQVYLDQWTALKPLIKDWIIYEGPAAYNEIHKERDFPSIQLVIIEKPKDFKEFEL